MEAAPATMARRRQSHAPDLGAHRAPGSKHKGTKCRIGCSHIYVQEHIDLLTPSLSQREETTAPAQCAKAQKGIAPFTIASHSVLACTTLVTCILHTLCRGANTPVLLNACLQRHAKMPSGGRSSLGCWHRCSTWAFHGDSQVQNTEGPAERWNAQDTCFLPVFSAIQRCTAHNGL